MPPVDRHQLASNCRTRNQEVQSRNHVSGIDARAERIAGVHVSKIFLTLSRRSKHQGRRYPVDADPTLREHARCNLGATGECLLRQGVT